MLFKIFVVFEINEVKDLLFWPLKTPYYVTWPRFLYNEIEIVKSNSSASYIVYKLLTGKKIFLKDFWPLLAPDHDLRGQPLLFGIKRKVLLF